MFDDFTVEENLQTSAGIYSHNEVKRRVEWVYAELPILAAFRKRVPFKMSGGERQVLAFGNALIHLPKLLLFDEPFAGIDEKNSQVLTDCIRKQNAQNTTFLIVEHKKQTLGQIGSREIKLELGTVKL